MDDLVDRLRGIYKIGPDGEFGTRRFGNTGFIAPISLEAAKEIERLQDDIKKLRYENEQLRETVTNQEIVIRCHQEACQSLDIGIGD